ncbi:kinase-like protein [Gymnopus androsaceus JB14]|uniref:Kinase-like protein n=1 Tax=Gymnopus androsaceus JB14 TaxID=1447944 RepID=A0A6A4GBJ4_9AGAR|nr:kinase-like protein [Gymnopus androsaceus JB14]
MSNPSDDNDEGPIFSFIEEPLGIPADEGFGFFQGTPEDILGPDDRFQLQAKLGFGINSSVWLAKDRQLGSHVALKILSGHATLLNAESHLRELEIHRRLQSLLPDETRHCNRLITHFSHQGIEQDGEHLCLVLELEQTSLQDVWKAHSEAHHALPTVKRIMRHMLRGLVALHRCGFAHTDLKPDNAMLSITPSLSSNVIDDWVLAHPPRVYPPSQSLYKIVTNAFVSERLPIPSIADLTLCDYKLADFSHAQQIDEQTTDHITPLTLRAPEVILGGPWDEEVDIWTFGCLVFTLLTRLPLFASEIRQNSLKHLRPGVDLTSECVQIFWQITAFTSQRYHPLVLNVYPNSSQYFEPNGKLKSFKIFSLRPLETCLRDAGCRATEKDIDSATALMRRCLALNPSDRPSALLLLEDPWLNE